MTVNSQKEPSAGGKLALWAILALCLVGLGLSVELTRIHIFTHTDPTYHSLCAVSEGVNCETVALSPYSIFAGLPVSVWGMGGYLIMALLALWSLTPLRLHGAWPRGLLVGLFGVSVGVSLVMAFLSLTRIDSLCLFCMATYLTNAALLILGVVAARRSGLGLGLLMADARALASRPILAALLVLLAGGGVGATFALVTPYWQSPGWADLPRLDHGTDAKGHPWVGSPRPLVEIVEFSDYECPHCRGAHKAIRLLVAKHADTVRLVHKHLPLDNACHPRLSRPFHRYACAFAGAAVCAGLQGRFWEMNDALFSIQDSRKAYDVDLEELAVRLGLDRRAFRECLSSPQAGQTILADIQEASGRGVEGTPTFFIGDKMFLGRIPEQELEQLLQGGSMAQSGAKGEGP